VRALQTEHSPYRLQIGECAALTAEWKVFSTQEPIILIGFDGTPILHTAIITPSPTAREAVFFRHLFCLHL